MRTAEEILNSHLELGADTYLALQDERIIAAMKEFAIEAIEKCAERAEASITSIDPYEADYKQSILSLINEVK